MLTSLHPPDQLAIGGLFRALRGNELRVADFGPTHRLNLPRGGTAYVLQEGAISLLGGPECRTPCGVVWRIDLTPPRLGGLRPRGGGGGDDDARLTVQVGVRSGSGPARAAHELKDEQALLVTFEMSERREVTATILAIDPRGTRHELAERRVVTFDPREPVWVAMAFEADRWVVLAAQDGHPALVEHASPWSEGPARLRPDRPLHPWASAREQIPERPRLRDGGHGPPPRVLMNALIR